MGFVTEFFFCFIQFMCPAHNYLEWKGCDAISDTPASNWFFGFWYFECLLVLIVAILSIVLANSTSCCFCGGNKVDTEAQRPSELKYRNSGTSDSSDDSSSSDSSSSSSDSSSSDSSSDNSY